VPPSSCFSVSVTEKERLHWHGWIRTEAIQMDHTYLVLKSLHILGVVLFLGNIIITGW